MSKAESAQVRDELLQSLYRSMLHCNLAFGEGQAVAAGVCANLQPLDLLLLPQRGGGAFRVSRGLAPEGRRMPQAELAAGVFSLPTGEASAVALTLGAAAAASRAGALVCALLPPGVSPEPARKTPGLGKLPTAWSEAGTHAARLRLPLLLISDHPSLPRETGEALSPSSPASAYPSIPVDRLDALAVYRVAFECTARARAGDGPSHLRCVPFRVRGRPPEEPDPLARVEAMLRQRGAFGKVWRRRMERELVKQVSAR